MWGEKGWQAQRMRWPLVLGVAGGAVAGVAAGCDAIGYCDFTWSQRSRAWTEGEGKIEIPVDAAPWLVRPCGLREAPTDCALVVDGVAIPVTAQSVGACELPLEDELAFQAWPRAIQTLTPAQPLPPGATAVLDCDDPEADAYDYGYMAYFDGDDLYPQPPLTLQIRTSSDPAAPPGELTDLELRYTRADPNVACTQGDYLEVRIDFAAQFLREGGYVEVAYPNGQVFEFSRPSEGGAAFMPASRGRVKFTPVAIDGERGETVVVDTAEIEGDLVYVPSCALEPSPGAPGLLAPMVWLALARRRRQGGGA